MNNAVQDLLVASQGKLFTSVDGSHVSSIYLGFSSNVSALQIPVSVAEGVIGGKVSLSDSSPATDFIYDTAATDYNTVFSDNVISLSGSNIQVVVSNAAISQLVYNGKVYSPSATDFNSGIALSHEIGKNVQLVPKGVGINFASCNEGNAMQVSFVLNADNTMSITSTALSVTGSIVSSAYNTPRFVSNSGAEYVVSFYSIDGTAVPSSIRFQLYQVMKYKPAGFTLLPKFKLVVGNC